MVEFGLNGFEKVATFSGFDLSGLSSDLMNDEEFVLDLKMISCEIDLSQYINPKRSAFLKVFKKVHLKYNENKIKKKVNDIFNNPETLQKIKDLDKKKVD